MLLSAIYFNLIVNHKKGIFHFSVDTFRERMRDNLPSQRESRAKKNFCTPESVNGFQADMKDAIKSI